MNLSIILLIAGLAILFFALTQRQKDKQMEKDLKQDPKEFFTQQQNHFPQEITINVFIKKEENVENI